MKLPAHRARQDLAIVAALTAAFALLSVRLDLSEWLARWARPVEPLQVDELPLILLVLAALLSWYAWRRTADLSRALADNRRLGRQLVDAQEAERRNLAREMHDELGQYLVAIRIDASSIGKDLESDRARARQSAASIVHHVEHLQAVVRDIIVRLRPAGLDELGLAAALESCVEAWRARLPGVDLRLSIDADLDRLGEPVDLAVYRLVQECLTNVSKHAAARRVVIELAEERGAGSARTLRFAASDDGTGSVASSAEAGRGFGLAGLRERVQSLGGDFRVDSAPGAGFRVVASIPLSHPQAETAA
jgi:two-component system, NarL family, sensor histidine kinase UhpB